VIILSALSPSFLHMKNTLPASAAVTTQNLIGLVLYTVIFLPIIWFVKPHQIRKFLYPSALFVGATFIGIIAYLVHENGGSAGNWVSSPVVLSRTQRAFRIVQCISSIGGSYGGAADRISDWTRFERKRGAANWAMCFALPISIPLVALIGVAIATTTTQQYGAAIWNPLVLLKTIQLANYTPACRAGTFFAGCGILSSQIFIQMSQNVIPYGMDAAALFPRYLSQKRASIFLVLCTLVIQPWRFLSQAAIFITILSSFTGKSSTFLDEKDSH
jgi:NCS1 family nucleobase:cation symporter-1